MKSKSRYLKIKNSTNNPFKFLSNPKTIAVIKQQKMRNNRRDRKRSET